MLESSVLCPRRNGDWVPNWARVATVQNEKEQPKIEGAVNQDSARLASTKSTLSSSQLLNHHQTSQQSSVGHTIKSVDSVLEVEAISAW